eukprot:TRINITY_DN12664_c0_g1_i2.p2 TRINITY_DN12664_c0_g1~~TRINITY_DN12664_c0_g1_i2.p2  ORF type:complete len:123 (-),score=28.55 TRINITY_DN12664_c0_g1_i2:70-438(-)
MCCYFCFFFFNDTATTEIYTRSIVGSVRCVQETVTYLHVIKGKILSDKQIKKLLNELLEELIKTVNKGILKEGIPLPNSKLFEFDNVEQTIMQHYVALCGTCLLYTSPSPRDLSTSRMPSSA